MEIWRCVVGYEGFYEVSSEGRVRRIAPAHGATVGRISTLIQGRAGYPVVNLSRGGVTKKPLLHKLVSEAFIGARPEGREVNHIDEDKWNARSDNLEFVTRSQNVLHTTRRRTHCRHGHHLNEGSVYYLRSGTRRCSECNRIQNAKRNRSSKRDKIREVLE